MFKSLPESFVVIITTNAKLALGGFTEQLVHFLAILLCYFDRFGDDAITFGSTNRMAAFLREAEEEVIEFGGNIERNR